MAHLLKLARLERLSDRQMVNELKTQLTDASAPTPSVETILHAALPHRYVDHTHADAVLAISDSRDGEARIRACYGDSVVVIPYVMPGFELARLVAERFPAEAHAGTRGMVLLQHGIFSFGASAEESYNRMIELVAQAEDYLQAQGAWDLPAPPPADPADRGPGAGTGGAAPSGLRAGRLPPAAVQPARRRIPGLCPSPGSASHRPSRARLPRTM